MLVMLSDPKISIHRFFDRPDPEKQFLYRLILEEPDPEKAMENYRNLEVTDDDAINTARELAKVQGLLVGTSSGANVWAAKQMAEKYCKDKVIATVLADRAERYFSTALI